MYTKLQSARLYQQMADQIRQLIVDGELTSGDKLSTERQFAEQFGVSRTVVREGLKVLAQERLVEIRPGKGTFVIDGTPQALRASLDLMMKINQPAQFTNVLEIREMLEPEIAAKAAARATEEQIKALQEVLVKMEAHFEDVDAYIAIDHEFHLILGQATQNALTSIIIESIVEFLHEQRKSIHSLAALNEEAKNTTLRVHKQILEAIIRRNPKAARKAMNEHMRFVRERSQTIFNLEDSLTDMSQHQTKDE